jgi:hypothetical protein
MVRILAVAIAVAFAATPDPAGAQSKPKDSPIAASRFGISVDGVQKPKKKGLKSSSSKKGSGMKSYKLQNAWPTK